jgi:mannose-6-phosphate isomerase-like protein (cupin superfamily)
MAESSIRRVVTGHDARGKAVVIYDGPTLNVNRPPNRPGNSVHNFWIESKTPTSVAGNADTATADKKISLEPPPGGHIFRVVEYGPEGAWIKDVDRTKAREMFADVGAAHASDPDANPPHPFMHKTRTIDYAIVMSGEIYAVLDDSETLLKAGDVLIQRGTNHAWSNRSNKPCRIAFILIDGTFE